MNKKIIILVVVVVAVIVGALLMTGYIKPYSSTGGPEVLASPQRNNGVDLKNFSFSPKILNVPVGTEVIWEQKDDTTHDVVSKDGLFASENLKLGDTFSFVFTSAGEYDYYCSIHPSMKGTIVVK